VLGECRGGKEPGSCAATPTVHTEGVTLLSRRFTGTGAAVDHTAATRSASRSDREWLRNTPATVMPVVAASGESDGEGDVRQRLSARRFPAGRLWVYGVHWGFGRGVTSLVAVLAAVALGVAGTAVPASAAAGISRVVTLGDSVPYGSACNCTTFGPAYAKILSRRLHRRVESYNFARSGATASSLRRQVEEGGVQNVLRQATTVVIMVGANDFASTFDSDQQGQCSGDCYAMVAHDLEVALTAVVARVQQIHRSPVSVILLDYWNVEKDGVVAQNQYGNAGVAKSRDATAHADDAIYSAAVARHVGYESTRDTFRGADDNTDPTPDLAADGDHPNAHGHQLIAEMLGKDRPRG
jgi:acyl-CoA thioesterase-1